MNVTHIDNLPPVARLLAKARALILDETRWTQATPATDKDESPVDVLATNACKWCAVGAVAKEADVESYNEDAMTLRAVGFLNDAALRLFDKADDYDVVAAACVNDDLGHEATIQMFDLAIGDAIKEGA